MNRLGFMAACVAALWTVAPTSVAEACSCLPPDVTYSYRNYQNTFVGKVLAVQTYGQTRVYDVRVRRNVKGCLTEGRVVKVTTAESGAACGAFLSLGTEYLLFGSSDSTSIRPAIRTNSCAGNTPVNMVSRADLDFLLGRANTCNGVTECVGGDPLVNCFVDPCALATPCSASAQCEANYCGGCNAEFYDNDYAVCEPW